MKSNRHIVDQPLMRTSDTHMEAAREVVDQWLSEQEGYAVRAERIPDGSLDWLVTACAIGVAEGVKEGMKRALEMRTGDHVHHMPSGETWVVAWADYSSGLMSACGWPESVAKIADCAMVKKATDEECAKLVQDLAKSGRRDAHRAAAILSNIDEAEVEAAEAEKEDRFAYWNSLSESKKAEIRQGFRDDMYGGTDD